jgi:hypothetical protein
MDHRLDPFCIIGGFAATARCKLPNTGQPFATKRSRHRRTVFRLTFNSAATAASDLPAPTERIIRPRRATCCGVPKAASHCSISLLCSSETVATGLARGMCPLSNHCLRYVHLFVGHYTSPCSVNRSRHKRTVVRLTRSHAFYAAADFATDF